MKMFLISDNKDTLTGLRLSGVDGIIVRDKELVNSEIDKACEDKDLAILLITEKLANLAKDKVSYVRMNLKTPLIVEIPDRHGSGRRKDFITHYINESIGINI